MKWKILFSLILVIIAKCTSLILRLPCGQIYADFTVSKFDHFLQGSVIRTIKGKTDIQCMAECAEHPVCRSYNIHRENKICELNSKKEGDFNVTLVQSVGWLYKSTDYNENLVGDTCKELNPCPRGILCKDTCDPPYYQCVKCDDRSYGLHCDKIKRKLRNFNCAINPCKNGGKCKPGKDKYKCECLAGYNGKHCETDIDECNSLPCFNGGACINQVNNFTCQCIPGYVGRHCETDFDECKTNPCRNGATCIDKLNSIRCICSPGFNGTVCETNIDDCKGIQCRNNGICIDLVCNCLRGFTGTLCETDIDEF